MATSVSSERAFSQGGITISKRRNRLKADIVEALQCVKCAIRNDLLFKEPDPSLVVEQELTSGAELDDSTESLTNNTISSTPSPTKDTPWDIVFDDEDEELCGDTGSREPEAVA